MEHVDHILIVDDDREIRQMVADYLQKNGLRATAVADGREMRALLDTHAEIKDSPEVTVEGLGERSTKELTNYASALFRADEALGRLDEGTYGN